MKISSKKSHKDEPHTITMSYLGDGKGRIDTYYYGDAEAPNAPIKNYSQLRLTKGAPLDEKLGDFTWKVRLKKLIKSMWF
ncbi:hypothetical protein ISG33_07410 [Glaciecola sp. MH2013]|uniref:hypothetical protein n=1 Tax=Glaciecola sp. MH2013 TaxID=2785524 RepID=UPI0018A0EB6E|nr:hypothetical protein [Glaciecola sp. MH2013]MBF7073222.1 hypothetical protein [Glaciecola sp. MH2013]